MRNLTALIDVFKSRWIRSKNTTKCENKFAKYVSKAEAFFSHANL
jgi:hypothetical protein